MLTNRSAPHARVTPVLTVTDVRAAVAWYSEVLGFVEHVRIGDAHRSQLGLPDAPAAELVVAEVRPGRRAPQEEHSHQVMFKVTDVTAVVDDVVALLLGRYDPLGDPLDGLGVGDRRAAVLLHHSHAAPL